MYLITSDNINFCDRYVYNLCRRIGRIPDDDAYQSGREGMVVASHRFDEEMSDDFNGYSTWWIKNYLYRKRFGIQCSARDAMGYGKVTFWLRDDDRIEDSFENQIINRDLAQKCIGLLSGKQKEVFIQRFYHDKSCYDLAKESGKTPQSFDLNYQKGKKKILKHFRGEM